MILVGATISGLSPFWMSLGVSYWFTILFMVTLSVGEVRCVKCCWVECRCEMELADVLVVLFSWRKTRSMSV